MGLSESASSQLSRKSSSSFWEKNIGGFRVTDDFRVITGDPDRLDACEENGEGNDETFGEDVGVLLRSEDRNGCVMTDFGKSEHPSIDEFLRDTVGEENTGVPVLEITGVLSEVEIGVTSEVDVPSKL